MPGPLPVVEAEDNLTVIVAPNPFDRQTNIFLRMITSEEIRQCKIVKN